MRAEPLAAKVADELVWPVVPLGQVDREQMREFVLRHLPEIGPASQAKVLQSLTNSFTQLGVATGDGTRLRFQIHSGTLAGFLYVLTAEFSRPGMYSFGELESGPMRRWLLWDREWIRRQLYNLQDLGIVSKVSEIDTIRQFTIGLDQAAALERFFTYPIERMLRGILLLKAKMTIPTFLLKDSSDFGIAAAPAAALTYPGCYGKNDLLKL